MVLFQDDKTFEVLVVPPSAVEAVDNVLLILKKIL